MHWTPAYASQARHRTARGRARNSVWRMRQRLPPGLGGDVRLLTVGTLQLPQVQLRDGHAAAVAGARSQSPRGQRSNAALYPVSVLRCPHAGQHRPRLTVVRLPHSAWEAWMHPSTATYGGAVTRMLSQHNHACRSQRVPRQSACTKARHCLRRQAGNLPSTGEQHAPSERTPGAPAATWTPRERPSSPDAERPQSNRHVSLP